MLYMTLLFFLVAITFGLVGFGEKGGVMAAPAHIAFVVCFLVLLGSLIVSLFPSRK